MSWPRDIKKRKKVKLWSRVDKKAKSKQNQKQK